MPEYTVAGLLWLAAGAIAAARAGLLRRRGTWIALGTFLAATVVFDWVLTGLPIVTYGAPYRSGLAVGPTPIEDFLYGQALCLTAITAYVVAGRRIPAP